MTTTLKALGRALLFVVVFHVLLLGSFALGPIAFRIVAFLLVIGVLRLFLSLFSGDPYVIARDPAFWLGVVVTTVMVIYLGGRL